MRVANSDSREMHALVPEQLSSDHFSESRGVLVYHWFIACREHKWDEWIRRSVDDRVDRLFGLITSAQGCQYNSKVEYSCQRDHPEAFLWTHLCFLDHCAFS